MSTTLNDIGQKIKGKTQQLKGEYHDLNGDKVQGLWEKAKGKVNETIADTKLSNHRKNNPVR